MHETFFGLQERPFPSAPLTEAFVPTESAEHARRQLERCIDRSEGVALIVGGAGTGKSLLLQLLAQRFHDSFHIARLTGAGLCTRRALLQSILYELGLPYRGMEEGELRLSLIDHLRPSRDCPHGMLLLLDEAHALPLRLLEEVRLITNLCDRGVSRVRLVMAGTLAFEERLASPKLAAFNQRIAARCYLHTMSSAETALYVRSHLQRVGARGLAIFTDSALRAIHTATDGIPRLTNQLCDHALLLAAVAGQQSIDAAGIQEAWSDLQQLPAPWSEPVRTAPSSIEFGLLEEIGTATSANPIERVEAQFDQLEEQLDEAQQDVISFLQDDAVPPPTKTGEITMSVHELHKIFGDGFDDEELVIDRFAALDAAALPHHHKVSTPEGELFSEEVRELLPPEKPQWKVVRAVEEADDSDEQDLASMVTFSVNIGPVAAESATEVSATEVTVSATVNDDPLPLEPADETPATIAWRSEESGIAHDFDPVYPEDDVLPAEPIARELHCEEPTSVPRPNTLAELIRKRRPTFQKLFASLRKS
jgi:type II secretory pathway predicted ATPase ExeA